MKKAGPLARTPALSTSNVGIALYCGQNTLVKRSEGDLHAKVLRCRSWNCLDCAPGRRRRLIAEACGGKPNKFITLTLRATDPRTQEERVKALSRAWRVMRARICRRLKIKTIPFLAVVERTKAGTPHLHILARAKFIDHAYLSNMAKELLDAPIVDIRHIDAHRGIATYVAKYVGKDPVKIGTCKRYWQAPGYDLRAKEAARRDAVAFSWLDTVKQPIASLRRSYERLGFTTTARSTDYLIFHPPPGLNL